MMVPLCTHIRLTRLTLVYRLVQVRQNLKKPERLPVPLPCSSPGFGRNSFSDFAFNVLPSRLTSRRHFSRSACIRLTATLQALFLWLKDATTPTSHAENLQEFRFTRVPFGVVCSPFLLAATVQHHLKTTDDANTTQLKREPANMNFRSWNSNSEAFLEQVPQEDQDDLTGFKVLRLRWHRVDDTLAVPAPDSTSLHTAITKRAILHYLVAVYDPLGLLSPVTIPPILLQYLWQANVGWDDDFPQPYLEPWTHWRIQDFSEEGRQMENKNMKGLAK